MTIPSRRRVLAAWVACALLGALLPWGAFSLYALTGDRYEAFWPAPTVPASAWRLREGDGELEGKGLRLLAPGRRGMIIAEAGLPAEPVAADVARVRVRVASEGDPPPLVLGWMVAGGAGQARIVTLPTPDADGWSEVATTDLDGWEGRLDSLLFVVRGEPGAGLWLQRVALAPPAPGFLAFQTRLFTGWVSWEPWTQGSINFTSVAGGRAMVSPVVAVATWIAVSALLFLAWRRSARAAALPVALMFALGWVVLDLRWQTELGYRLADTHQRFAGLDSAGKRAADVDGDVFRFMEKLKTRMPGPETRVIVISTIEFYRLRARYHVLPNPALALPRVGRSVARWLRAGDHVVLLEVDAIRPATIAADIGGNATRFDTGDFRGRDLESRRIADTMVGFLPSRRARLLAGPEDEARDPGYYRVTVPLAAEAPEGRVLVRVDVLREGQATVTIAEREFRLDSTMQDYDLPAALPASGRLRIRVIPRTDGVSVGAIELAPLAGDLAHLTSGEPPYLVVRPVLRDPAGLAFEVQ